MIDEVRIYKRALSSAEIQQLYLSNLAKYNIDRWTFTISPNIDGNRTYYGRGQDTFGWTGQSEMRTNTIDTSVSASLSYQYTQSGAVVTLTGIGEPITALNNEGSLTHILSGSEKTFTFIFQDQIGNTGSIVASFWNNDKYIDSSFWDTNPNDAMIISAVLGDGDLGTDKTAYTDLRSGNTCTIANMRVVKLNPGIDTLPNTLVTNTVYVLNQ